MDIKSFLETEEKYDLINSRVEGICFWEISRFTIWQYKLCAKSLDLGTSNRMSSDGEIKHKTIHYLFNGMKLPGDIKGAVLFIDHPRRVKVGDSFDCMYTEELSKRYRSIVLEGTGDGRHSVPVRTKNLVYYDSVLYFAQRYYERNRSRNSAAYKAARSQIKEKLEKPLREILDSYGVEMDPEELYEVAVQNLFKYKYIRKQAGRLLDRIKPSLIVEVVYYSLFCMAVNEMAKKRGIVTVELQHGTMHEEHAAYQYGTNEFIEQLPDHMFLFSDYWKKVAHIPERSTAMTVTGFPYFEDQVRKFKGDADAGEDKKTILFISQGTIGRELSKLAVEISGQLAGKGYRLIYKLHPGEYAGWKSNYPWLYECRDIETADADGKGVYDYFAISSVQVGVYSTAMYEGLGFGLTTYVYKIGHWDTMQTLCDMGYIQMFDSAKELIGLIDSEENGQVDCRDFWKKDSLNNMVKELDALISDDDSRQS